MKRLVPNVTYPIAFVHVPRSGGITVADIMTRQYRAEQLLFFYAEDALRELDAMPRERRQRLRVLHGHHRFGIHSGYFDAATYTTLFREPVSRIISYYSYIINRPTHALHRLVVERRLSLRDLVGRRLSVEFDNGQTRQLSGQMSVPVGACSPTLFAEACENLERHFPVFGITERFDESIILMMNAFAWSSPYYKPMNTGRDAPRPDAIHEETLEVIRETNMYDIQLYALARRRFAQMVAAAGPTFQRQLRGFRFKNGLVRPLFGSRCPVFRRLRGSV